MATSAEVLKVLNMTSSEFLTGVVDLHINSASVTIDAINRNHLVGAIVEEAKLRLAAYLSYLAYCDDPKNSLPGSIDPTTGRWVPVGDPANRINMAAKLAAMKTASDEAIAAMQDAANMPTGYAPAFGALRFK